jgi:hypothetical protein
MATWVAVLRFPVERVHSVIDGAGITMATRSKWKERGHKALEAVACNKHWAQVASLVPSRTDISVVNDGSRVWIHQ